MNRKFHYHPDRSREVLLALRNGSLVATFDQLVEDRYMPLVGSDDKAILGWWVDMSLLEKPTWPRTEMFA